MNAYLDKKVLRSTLRTQESKVLDLVARLAPS